MPRLFCNLPIEYMHVIIIFCYLKKAGLKTTGLQLDDNTIKDNNVDLLYVEQCTVVSKKQVAVESESRDSSKAVNSDDTVKCEVKELKENIWKL